MAQTDPILATRDLVGTFSVILDEFAACWGGLRIANDQLRAAIVLELTEEVGARSALADWIEPRLATDHAALVAPLVALLWSSGGSTPGALHSFEASLDPSAPAGARRLLEVLSAAFEAYHQRQPGVVTGSRGTAQALLASMASTQHRFGLPAAVEEEIDRATGALWVAGLDRDYYPGHASTLDRSEEALAVAARIRGWRRNAFVGQADLVALPGLEFRQYTLTPMLAPHSIVLLRLAEEITDIDAIRERCGPALVTAWDSFGHTFGEETDDSDLDPPGPDDPFRDPGGYRGEVGPEASQLLDEAAWFAGLLAEGEGAPRLGGGIRALLASTARAGGPRSGDPHVEALLNDAQASLERLAANLGDPGQSALEAIRAKAAAVETAAGPEVGGQFAAYVLRVVEELIAVADEASAFAEHLRGAEGESVGDLDLALRLAAIVAWVDAVGRWIVSDAVMPSIDAAPDRTASPPPGYLDPGKLLREVVASMPESYPVEEYRLVLEQRDAQWDEIAVLDDGGRPDFEDDWSDVVDIEGFADR